MAEERRRPPRPPREAGGFKLKTFPKEFERDFFAGLDRTFFSILALTVLIFLPSIYILSQNASELFGLNEEERLERKKAIIKKLYVQVVEEEEPEEIEEPEEKPEEEKTEEDLQEDRKEQLKTRTEAPKKRSFADVRAARLAARNAAEARRSAEEQAITSSGAIALLTGGAGSDGLATADLLGDASSSDINLDKALSNVDGLAVGSNGTGTPGTGISGRGTKGGRSTGGGSVDGLVGGVGGATSKSVGKRRGGIELGNIQVRGSRGEKSRSQSEISKVVNKSQGGIEQCFKKEQRLNPSLKGYITVSFKITKRGTIRDVKIVKNTVNSSRVASCVKRVITRMRGFGRAKGDVTVPNLKFTFN